MPLKYLFYQMSKPFSIRTEPWSSFDKQSYFIFTDDFVHQKFFTVKVNQKPGRSAINLKNQIEYKDKAYKSTGEIKLWFPIWNTRNGYLYFKSNVKMFKIHYDDGLKQILNGKFNYYNLYASFQSSKTFKNAIIKVGSNLLAKNFSFDNRLRVNFTQSGSTDVSTGHKFSWAKDNWSFDTYNNFSFKSSSIISNAIRVSYRQGDNDFFFRAYNQKERSLKGFDFTNLDTYFSKFIFDFVRRLDSLTSLGIQTQLTKKNHVNSSVVFQRSIPSRQAGVKARLSSNRSIALCYQSVLRNYGKWTVGWEVSGLGQENKSAYGVQLEINL